jgi:hypothetical protein
VKHFPSWEGIEGCVKWKEKLFHTIQN